MVISVDLTLLVESTGLDHTSKAAIATPSNSPEGLLTSESEWQRYFQQWLTAIDPQRSPSGAYMVSLQLTTDAEMQSLNASYRQQDKPTDVLAFAALEWVGPPLLALADEPLDLGDIMISVETAARQAAEHGHSLDLEVVWLAAHGLLHLLGWDHPTAPELNQMLVEQSRLLGYVGLTAPAWTATTLGYPS